MVGIGILLSQVPMLEFKRKDGKRSEKLTLLVNAIGFILSFAALVYLAYVPGYSIGKLHLMACVAGPAVLYFAVALPVRSKFLNLLGELSAFIYIAQCPILLHHYYVSRDTRDQFPLYCICILAMFVINRIVNCARKRRKCKAI